MKQHLSPSLCSGQEEPMRTVKIDRSEHGIRLILDHDGSLTEPDILIEHESGNWNLFVHPDGNDPVAVITIKPDRSVAVEDAISGKVLAAWPKP